MARVEGKSLAKVGRHPMDIFHQCGDIFKDVSVDSLKNVADGGGLGIQGHGEGVVDMPTAVGHR